ncbi:MAG TPA: hypothetical protein VHP30_15625 [Ignavibacteriales bacterium]|nr:hypothetical protein [Ignavibacteriales bacterium]
MSFLDIIDIIIVAFIIYKLYNIIKGSIAAQIFCRFDIHISAFFYSSGY